MAENPYLGAIFMFAGNFAPAGYQFCDGQTLSISQNAALFSILGTTYGGNGVTTFQLPDLRSRVPIHAGQGTGLTNYVEGQSGGEENVTLTEGQMPTHNHQVSVGDAETTNMPHNAFLAQDGSYATTADAGGEALAPTAVGNAGGSQAHPNIQPYLAVNFIIAMTGIFPSRN